MDHTQALQRPEPGSAGSPILMRRMSLRSKDAWRETRRMFPPPHPLPLAHLRPRLKQGCGRRSTCTPRHERTPCQGSLEARAQASDAIPGDGLRCLSCGELVDAIGGWRTRHIHCERKYILAMHKPATCRRIGCINCNLSGLCGFKATSGED
jgi:hypothetical protein